MKVRIVSGNQAGQVHDLPQVDAESAIATGYAVAVTEEAIVPAEVVIPAPAPAIVKPVEPVNIDDASVGTPGDSVTIPAAPVKSEGAE